VAATAESDTNILTELREMRQALEKANKPNGPPAGTVFGRGDSPFTQHNNDDWPVERLNRISESYGSPVAQHLFCKRLPNGKHRVSGFGKALVKLAAMSGNKEAQGHAKAQGLWNESYGDEQLEREFGFMPALRQKGLNGEVQKTALAEGSGITGGYTVPPQFMNELLTIAVEDGFIEQRAKVIPMNTREVWWPTLDITTNYGSGITPYLAGVQGTWQPEAATISETEPQFRQTQWTAWDLVLYTVSSNQLLADNGVGLDALLTQIFGQAITWYKEFAYLQGKGAGSTMPQGILNAPATYVQNRAVTSRFLLADAAAMMAHLQIRSWDDACWIMHQSVLPQLILMVDGGSATGTTGTGASTSYPGGNRLVWMNPTMSGDRGPAATKMPNAFFNGLPVFFTEKLPSLNGRGDVLLVDWSRYIIGMRLDLQIDVSPHYLFKTNQLAWRVIARLDGKPWLNNTITDQAGWSVSPFVALGP
jgi:HK97 family phage major capsid protein